MADVHPPPPLSVATTVAVAAAAGAMGFGIVYWMTAEPSLQQQAELPQTASQRGGDGEDAATSRQQKSGWSFGWPWSLRSHSREAAGAEADYFSLSANPSFGM